MQGRMWRKAGLYINTVKYLRPTQIAGQLTKPLKGKAGLKGRKRVKNCIRQNIRTWITELDGNSEFLSRFDPDELLHNRVTLLNETHELDLKTWQAEALPLWRFNLHYLEYCICLGEQFREKNEIRYYRSFRKIVLSWIKANPESVGDGWHPYTISLRIPNLFVCLELFQEPLEKDRLFREQVMGNIYRQYCILLRRKETWLLGNHYLENLKTILLCSLVFGEENVYEKHIRLFQRELREQILADGMHFEQSPMYHKIILEDVIRVAFWLRQAGKREYLGLLPTLQRMADAGLSLEKGMGRTPLFNDSGDNVAKPIQALLEASERLFGIQAKEKAGLDFSGYYKLYGKGTALLFDAGKIGPDYMPGHGHCDCLSFELSLNGRPLFVNGGTFQYQGRERNYFRSAKAHNTVEIGEHQQSECWGEHRGARRIHGIRVRAAGEGIVGEYQNYLGESHRRRISLDKKQLTVWDLAGGRKGVTVHSYLHIAPGFCTFLSGRKIGIADEEGRLVCAITPMQCDFQIHDSGELAYYAPEFGLLNQGRCVEFCWKADGKQHGYAVVFGDAGVQTYSKRSGLSY